MSSATNSIQPCSQGATIQVVPSMSCSSSQDSSMMPAVSFSNSGILLPMGMLPSVSVVQNPAQMLPAASVQPAMQQPVQPAMQQAVQPVPQQPQACTAQYSSVGYQLAPIQTGTGQSFNSLMQVQLIHNTSLVNMVMDSQCQTPGIPQPEITSLLFILKCTFLCPQKCLRIYVSVELNFKECLCQCKLNISILD